MNNHRIQWRFCDSRAKNAVCWNVQRGQHWQDSDVCRSILPSCRRTNGVTTTPRAGGVFGFGTRSFLSAPLNRAIEVRGFVQVADGKTVFPERKRFTRAIFSWSRASIIMSRLFMLVQYQCRTRSSFHSSHQQFFNRTFPRPPSLYRPRRRRLPRPIFDARFIFHILTSIVDVSSVDGDIFQPPLQTNFSRFHHAEQWGDDCR